MDMHKAAIAPRQPHISADDRKHPLFPTYQRHRSFCVAQLIEATAFGDWLYQYERDILENEMTQHPRYSEFRQWMIDQKGGARKCPVGIFPHNFKFWLAGGRW